MMRAGDTVELITPLSKIPKGTRGKVLNITIGGVVTISPIDNITAHTKRVMAEVEFPGTTSWFMADRLIIVKRVPRARVDFLEID